MRGAGNTFWEQALGFEGTWGLETLVVLDFSHEHPELSSQGCSLGLHSSLVQQEGRSTEGQMRHEGWNENRNRTVCNTGRWIYPGRQQGVPSSHFLTHTADPSSSGHSPEVELWPAWPWGRTLASPCKCFSSAENWLAFHLQQPMRKFLRSSYTWAITELREVCPTSEKGGLSSGNKGQKRWGVMDGEASFKASWSAWRCWAGHSRAAGQGNRDSSVSVPLELLSGLVSGGTRHQMCLTRAEFLKGT